MSRWAMCLTAPARVVRIEGDDVIVDLAGRTRRASLLLEPDVRPGDWVLVGAGRVVRRISADEARDLARLVVNPVNQRGASS